MGAPCPTSRTVTEHVDTTVRWNRSSGIPRAAATIALIGSAWLTATIASPRWRAPSSTTASQHRACSSLNDSPRGKRNVLGVSWTERHSRRRRSAESLAPVQSPKSHSKSPGAVRTRRCSARAMGAAVSMARSSGEA